MYSSSGGSSVRRATEVWLQNEHLDDDERLERLTADKQFFKILRASHFQGTEWDFVVNELARYGIAVIRAWVRRNEIGRKCAAKSIRCPTIPEWIRQDSEAPGDIATETVAVAIVHYRDDVLAKGVWDPSKGASLRTFFIGQCLLRFPNAYRMWEKTVTSRLVEIATEDVSSLATGSMPAAEDDVIRSLTSEQILAGAINERAARVLAMDACGYSNAEIAADVGVGLEAVKGILKRERARLKKAMSTERGAS